MKRKLIILIFIFIIILIINTFPKSIKELSSLEIYDSNNEPFYYEINDNYRNWVSLNNINDKFIKMLINKEDKNFYKHFGFSIKRIIKSGYNNIFRNKREGASTITQQYARTIYLNNSKTIKRKFKELYYSILLESFYTKEQILEGYLNSIYFGNGIYGIKDASLYYFNKDPKDLTINESAILLSLINGPSLYNPKTNLYKLLNKKNNILKNLLDNDIISLEEYNNALNEKITFYYKEIKLSSSIKFFKDEVKRELKELKIKKKNIKVYTSFEKDINNFIDNINFNDKEHAIILTNNLKGNIISIIGSNDYDYSSYNRCHSKRQIASLVKPFLYYMALNYGYTPLTTHKSAKESFTYKGITYSPKNYNNIYQNKDITMVEALASSDNIYAVKTCMDFSPLNLMHTLESFNIEASDDITISLGSNSESLLNIMNAYSIFSTLGKKVNISTIDKIVYKNKTIYKKPNPKDYIDSGYAYVINNLLNNTFNPNIKYSTASIINDEYTSKTSAKSGTSDYDSWFIGYNKDITLGIWSGYDDNKYLSNSDSKYIYKEIIDYYLKKIGISYYDIPKSVYNKKCYINGYNMDIYYRSNLPKVK